MPSVQFSSVQSLSRVRLFATPWIAARQASLSITNSRSSLKLMSIKSVMPSSHLILCRPLPLLPQSLPTSGSFPVSQLFSRGGRSIGVSAFGISLSNEHPGLISFRVRVRFLLFCLRNQKKKKKKAPIFWWELPSNFQIVEVQCWLPFISQDVWAKISTDDSNGKHASKRSPLVLLVLEVQ